VFILFPPIQPLLQLVTLLLDILLKSLDFISKLLQLALVLCFDRFLKATGNPIKAGIQLRSIMISGFHEIVLNCWQTRLRIVDLFNQLDHFRQDRRLSPIDGYIV